tara:strand:+ start:7098 stop:11210 length:4113 start_codon:yes stop_codon:yes gene_type:complete
MPSHYHDEKDQLPSITPQEQAEKQTTQYSEPPPPPSNKDIKEQMDNEYNEWWNLPNEDPNRILKKERYYQKWYDKPLSEIEEEKEQAISGGMYGTAGGLRGYGQHMGKVFQTMSAPGMGLIDFGMDAIGNLPGAAPIDNWWDKQTEFDDPAIQKFRNIMSVVIPSIWAGRAVTGQLGKMGLANAPRVQQVATAIGAFGVTDAAIIGLSDEGYENTITQAMAEGFPGVFGPKGWLPLPKWSRTLDSDSPEVRKYKNMLENTVFSGAATILGAWIEISKGAKGLSWFQPLNNTAAAYKTRELSRASDPDKLIRIQEINNALTTKKLSRKVEAQLIDELETLKDSMGGIDSFEEALRQQEVSAAREVDEAAKGKIARGDVQPNQYDPDVTPVADNTKPAVPPGNVARNQADVAAIKAGQATGDPAPIITESMRNKGLMVGSTSRDAVMGVAEQARDLGRFDALVNGFRFSKKNMDALAFDVYTSIIAAENMDDLRGIFLDYKDTKTLLGGKLKVEYITEEQARGAAFAMRDLVDRFLGRDIAMNSARVMDTMGREAATLAEAVQDLKPFMDDQKGMDLVIDKLQFLMDEYALNKYISGWQLKNKDWADAIPPADFESTIKTLTSEFKKAENTIHRANLKLTKELKQLAKTNPLAMRPLMDAFAYTKGDVDSFAKLMRWAGDQITPRGMLVSPNPREMNLFARNAFSVVFNNVLSGLSAFRAGLDVTSKLTLRPITQIMGSALWGPLDGFDSFRRTMYYNGAMFETNRRSLTDAWSLMKKAHKDPELMLKAYRKDLAIKKTDTAKWDLMEQMRSVWEAEGNQGKLMLLDFVIALRNLSKAPWMRFGMTGLTGPDAFVWTHIAHQLSRIRAYDEIFSEFGFADWKKIFVAEKKHYKNFFDDNGLIKDSVLKNISGEITLNLDDRVASWLNQATTTVPISRHLFMFPRTQLNDFKHALSWTGFSSIPGMQSKYGKTIWARTDDEIAAALAEHGASLNDVGGRHLFENLRNEYIGRIAFSGLLAQSLWQYAMDGNIRGNGHYNPDRRKKERDQMGYTPKEIKIAGKWLPYDGIPGVEQVLSTIGDLSYYAADIEEPMLANWFDKLTWSLAANFLNDTPLQSIEPLIAAINGELGQWNRLIANTARSYLPNSSALAVLADAISTSQKDIQGEIWEYMANKLPLANMALDERVDIWTGDPIDDIHHPFAKLIHSVTKINVSQKEEPWRIWLRQTGWNGLHKLNKDSSGSYEYSTAERKLIHQYMAEQNMSKKIKNLMKNKTYNKQIGQLRFHRATGSDLENDKIKLDSDWLPVISKINEIVKDAQWAAEQRLLNDRPDIANIILHQKLAQEAMKEGNVQRATELQKKELETRQLLQMAK